MLTAPLTRLVVIALLLGGLLIPLGMTWGLVTERAQRRDAVAAEIGAMWGGAQRVSGPVLTIPYRCAPRESPPLPPGQVPAVKDPCSATAVLLPDSLAITGTVEPTLRRRGVFDVVVYRAHLAMKATFPPIALDELTPKPTTPEWDDGAMAIGVSDPKGVEQKIRATCNQQPLDFRPGASASLPLPQGMSARLPLGPASRGGLDCTLEFDIKGTRSLMFFPAGGQTTLELASSWPHPSFGGWILPERYDIRADGFNATWRSGAYGRPLAGMWSSLAVPPNLTNQAEGSEFGLTLVQPIDPYIETDRAVKYGVLFLLLTFMTVFIWEITRGVRVHPIQYLFVGFALCVFYLLLLAFSEHIGFDRAYLVASTATVALIAWYWRWVTNGVTGGAAMAGILALLYGLLFLLLRLEDYALLAGAIGLFIILAIVMFITRRVNWEAGEPSR
jgi:inner membrane protein